MTFFTARLAVAIAGAVLVSGCGGGSSPVHISRSVFGSSSQLDGQATRAELGDIHPDVQSIEIINRLGSVRVTGTDQEPFGWRWDLTARAATDGLAREAAGAARCVVTSSDGRLLVEVRLPDAPQRSFSSSLELRVPQAVAVKTRNQFGPATVTGVGTVVAQSRNGAVEVRDVGGEVRVETSFAPIHVHHSGPASLRNQNGQIEATRIRGGLDAETSFAPVRAEDIEGLVSVRNRNGAIRASRIAGEARLRTSFAVIDAEDVTGDAEFDNRNGRITAAALGGNVKARTSFALMEIEAGGRNLAFDNQNGSIRVRAVSPDLSRLSAATSFASMEVRLPAALDPAIEARTSFGKIESDFPVLLPPEGRDPFEGASAKPRISLRNQNGGIRIQKNH